MQPSTFRATAAVGKTGCAGGQHVEHGGGAVVVVIDTAPSFAAVTAAISWRTADTALRCFCAHIRRGAGGGDRRTSGGDVTGAHGCSGCGSGGGSVGFGGPADTALYVRAVTRRTSLAATAVKLVRSFSANVAVVNIHSRSLSSVRSKCERARLETGKDKKCNKVARYLGHALCFSVRCQCDVCRSWGKLLIVEG
jgi:hypothetical protein